MALERAAEVTALPLSERMNERTIKRTNDRSIVYEHAHCNFYRHRVSEPIIPQKIFICTYSTVFSSLSSPYIIAFPALTPGIILLWQWFLRKKPSLEPLFRHGHLSQPAAIATNLEEEEFNVQ